MLFITVVEWRGSDPRWRRAYPTLPWRAFMRISIIW
jgi:hypothetical protein